MSINRNLNVVMIVTALLLVAWPSGVQAAAQEKLATAKSLRCTFPLNATGTWKDGKPEAAVKPATLVLQFDTINTDEGTARLTGEFGAYDIIVRLSAGYLHFIQLFRGGSLYTTTVFEKESSGGKMKAVHSRHEYFDVALTGFTSSPEQYYGECEIMN